MFIFDFLKKLLGIGYIKEPDIRKSTIYHDAEQPEEIHSVWDYIKLNENTQAFHICAVLGFEEWVPMDEILRRIKEVFGMDYKNDRSLYPYIKTLVDVGLVETSSVGGKKKWRKRDVLIKAKTKKSLTEEQAEQATARIKK